MEDGGVKAGDPSCFEGSQGELSRPADSGLGVEIGTARLTKTP